jgi:YgiT-type zinc finger domain-containing protein
MSINGEEAKQFCEGCHIGSLQPYRTTYAHWHYGQFIIVPGVPSWRCDFCGDTFYDEDALSRLALLLGPESASGNQRRWRTTGLDESAGEGLADRWRVC